MVEQFAIGSGTSLDMVDPLVFSPQEHRYRLAVRQLPASTKSVADVGGYRSRRRHLADHLPNCMFTAVNVGAAWYEGEEVDILYEPGGSIPAPNRAFDAAISVDVMEHMESAARSDFVGEVCRIAARTAVIVVPFAGTERPSEEETLLKLTRLGGISDMPSLAEHVAYGLPRIEELFAIADRHGMTIEPATDRRIYWAAQWTMAVNQLALGDGARILNRRISEWQEELLRAERSPRTFATAYRAVLTRHFGEEL